MTRTLEIEVDASGVIHSVDPCAKLPLGRATLTWQTPSDSQDARLSEAALADDWLRQEEDAAWQHLQPGK